MTGTIDFTNCKKILGRAYNGANGKKIAVEYNGREYMLKFPPSGATKPTELSYTNSCISEHIASSIFNMVGIKAQETLLGTYEVSGKVKVVCACRDFTEKGYRLFDFCSIKNTILDSESGGSGTELADIMDTIEKQQYVEPSLLMQHFFNVFVVDALLGNFDRHNGNWGFLYDDSTKEASIAPVYDCGSCLYPQADEAIMRDTIDKQPERDLRTFSIPLSSIKVNGKKINYFDFISSLENADCSKALKRILPKINMDAIFRIVDETPFISDLQKQFYKTMLQTRKERILDFAMEKLRKREKAKELDAR